MSSGYDLLVVEADRIVNSPYPTQLKQLHVVVCSKCTEADITGWASSRPCQTDALARNLLEALHHWPYVLEIIAKLSTSRQLRDGFLKHDENLLFEIVSQAVSGSYKHNAASIEMLSHPLPPHITPPAACQNLFLGIVDHAAQSPSSTSMRPVYKLLKGGLGPLLGLLSHDVLSQIEDHFLETLQNTIGQGDQCLSLYCFSVMKTVVAAAEEDVTFSSASAKYETQELLASTPSSPKWKPEGMQKFFNAGRKAHKALHLIVVRVLYSTQFTDKDAVEEVIECLGLANELVQYLPVSVREAWCAQNPLVVQKLKERALQPGLDTRMQLQAFAFLFTLCRSQDIPEPLTDRLSELLLDPAHLITGLCKGHESPMARFAEALSETRICDVFTTLSDFILTAEPSELLRIAEAVVATVHCFTVACDPSNTISAGAVAALGSSSLADTLSKLRQLFCGDHTSSPTRSGGVCGIAVLQTRKSIAHALCGLFLKAALTADQTDVPSDVYPLLIELHALSVTPGTGCDHVKQQSRTRRSDNQRPMPYAPGTDWREALDEHLKSKAQNEHSNLSRLFASACEDLEKRCSEVEAPLRAARTDRQKLQEQYDDLARDYAVLEEEKNDMAACIEDMEAEKHESVRGLEEGREENDGLISRIDELEVKARQNQEAAKQQLAALKRDMDIAEMEYATNFASNQEQLDNVQSKLAKAQDTLASKDAATEALQTQLDSAKSAGEAFEADREAWNNAETEYRRANTAVEQARGELSTKCIQLSSDLDAVQADLAAEKRVREDDIAEARRQAARELEMAKAEGERGLAEVHHHHHLELEDWKQQMATAQQEYRKAHEENSSQLAKKDKKLTECLKKIEHLKGVVTERDEQIAEANAMRLNLMAAMGIGKQRSQANNRRTTRSAAAKETAVDESDISIPFMDTLGSTTKPAAQRGLDFATQGSQAAPSPKRAKPRKSVRTMSPSQTLLTTFSQAAKDDIQRRTSLKRQPLLALSANRSPGKGDGKTPRRNGTKELYEDDIDDDTTFDGSGVFSCTPALAGQARDEEPLPDDETMLE